MGVGLKIVYAGLGAVVGGAVGKPDMRQTAADAAAIGGIMTAGASMNVAQAHYFLASPPARGTALLSAARTGLGPGLIAAASTFAAAMATSALRQ